MGAKRDKLDRPDRMILDLDPGPAVDWSSVIEGAQLLRTLLSELNLTSFVKTTGGKGLHVVVPLQRVHTWDEVKTFSKSLAEHLERMIPERFVATMSKAKRKERSMSITCAMRRARRPLPPIPRAPGRERRCQCRWHGTNSRSNCGPIVSRSSICRIDSAGCPKTRGQSTVRRNNDSRKQCGSDSLAYERRHCQGAFNRDLGEC